MKRRRSRVNNQSRKAKAITPDAFLEAVLDGEGDEAFVLEALEVRDRELHAWMAQQSSVVEAARDTLLDRGVDITEPVYGWLRGNDRLISTPDDDENWARYRDLLLEEQVLDERAVLEQAKSRTAELIERLQAEKRARRERQKPQPEPDPP